MVNIMATIFKIRNKDGKFSNGGSDPDFVKNGKMWTHFGYLNRHLDVLSERGKKVYKDNGAVIVQYELIEPVEVQTIDVMEHLSGVLARSAERARARPN